MTTDAIQRDEKRDERGRFIVPPKSPGRPIGARNRLGDAFIEALEADFNENGVAAIQAVRAEKPEVYVKVIAGLLPKDVNLNVNQMDELSDDELVERIRSLAAIAQPLLAGTGSVPAGISAPGDYAGSA